MTINKTNELQLQSLIKLIDDPDEEVFGIVQNQILSYGKFAIPSLENLWELSVSNDVQERIEMLIHKLCYTDLTEAFTEWHNSNEQNLVHGAMLVAQFQYPDLDKEKVFTQIEKLRKNIWLELNNYLTPLEQANVLSSILYNYFGLKGREVDYTKPNEFYIHKVLESKKGNAIINAIIYQAVCEMLNVNARLINIPQQAIIAFYKTEEDIFIDDISIHSKIHFYVDVVNGSAYSHREIDAYLKRMGLPVLEQYFKPQSHLQIIQLLLTELSKCFTSRNKVELKKEIDTINNLLND